MTLSLHTIRKSRGVNQKRKRIGRGNASGTGTYSGKGLKGQKSRSGVSNLKRLGMRQTLLRTPKKRGFKSLKPKAQVVNLTVINKFFKNGEEINPKTLLKKGLVDNVKDPIKILGQGELKVKKLEISEVKLSQTVVEQLKKNGGAVVEAKKEEVEKAKTDKKGKK